MIHCAVAVACRDGTSHVDGHGIFQLGVMANVQMQH